MNTELKEHLEYLLLYSNDAGKIKRYVTDNNIDINDVDYLTIICMRNDENIFNLFLNELNADYTINNYSILKYYAFAGNMDMFDYLIKKCNVNITQFILSCQKSTLTNSKNTIEYLAKFNR